MTPVCERSGKNYELLLDYCAGKLDIDQTVILERHLSACLECAKVRESFTQVWEALDHWHMPEVSADFDKRLYARLSQDEALPWYRQWVDRVSGVLLRPAIPLGIAAGLLFIVGIWHRPAPVAVSISASASAPTTGNKSAEMNFSETEADQMERTLDDLEMLRQFDVHPEESEKLSNSM